METLAFNAHTHWSQRAAEMLTLSKGLYSGILTSDSMLATTSSDRSCESQKKWGTACGSSLPSTRLTYLCRVWDVVNRRKKTSGADNKGKVPDGERRVLIISDIKCSGVSNKCPVCWQSVNTHNGSFRSNSTGVGGLLGDCQNKPKAEMQKPWQLLLKHYVCLIEGT